MFFVILMMQSFVNVIRKTVSLCQCNVSMFQCVNVSMSQCSISVCQCNVSMSQCSAVSQQQDCVAISSAALPATASLSPFAEPENKAALTIFSASALFKLLPLG